MSATTDEPLLMPPFGDLGFFNELYEDLRNMGDNAMISRAGLTHIPLESTPSPSPSPRTSTIASVTDHHREHTLAAEINRFWPETEWAAEWRRIAQRQKKERDKAEKENAKLRQLVADHFEANQKICQLFEQAETLASKITFESNDAATAMPYRALRHNAGNVAAGHPSEHSTVY